jgi:hypothetical protein
MKRAALLAIAGCLFLALPLRAATPAPAPSADDSEKEGTISGIAIERAQGGWVGVEIKGGCFRLTFYDAKKKPTPADRTSAVLWWPVHYQPNNERTELLPSDDPSVLTSSYPVKPPHTFKLHISLMADSLKDPEGYVIDFSAD